MILAYFLWKIKVPQESRTLSKLNHLFLGPLSTFTETGQPDKITVTQPSRQWLNMFYI